MHRGHKLPAEGSTGRVSRTERRCPGFIVTVRTMTAQRRDCIDAALWRTPWFASGP